MTTTQRFEVTQVNGAESNVGHTPTRRSYIVTDAWVSPLRAWMDGRAARIPAESSDWVSVQEV